MIQIIIFSLLMSADITMTHLNMKKYRKICPTRYWELERNFIIRWFYEKFSMKIAFTITLIYFIPWVVVLYYLFLRNSLFFPLAFLVYLAVFIVHFFMSKYLSKEIAYRMILQDTGVDRFEFGT